MGSGYDFSSLGVMVVDDNEHMLRILQTLLSSMRVGEVRCFSSGPDALDELRDWLPDVVITDHYMQPLTGIDFIKHIRSSSGPCRFAPVVLLTGYAGKKLVRAARDSGADYTMTKPVSLQAVYRTFVRLRQADRSFIQTSRYFGPDRRRKERPYAGPDKRAES
jgi:CheY-like chemotaxis protein